MNSLSLINDYISSDDEEDVKLKQSHKRKLPLPELPEMKIPRSISRLKEGDSKSDHQGKIRNFKHEAGNWATYVCVPIEPTDDISLLIQELNEKLNLKETKDLHVSLTKTIILKHHWIDDFINSTKQLFANYHAFIFSFQGLKVLLNDEKTRTFVAFEVKAGKEHLNLLVKQLDLCLEEYRLPKFYEDPSFHCSFGWCLGDKSEELNKLISMSLNDNQPHNLNITVNFGLCKTGNKFFKLPLGG